MPVELQFLSADEAEPIARELLAQDIGGKFHAVLDRSRLLDEACVLLHDGVEYVGFATVTANGETCEVYRFFVVPSKRGAGIGTDAARQLERVLASDGYGMCYFQIDDEDAIRFWSRAVGPLQVVNETSGMYAKSLIDG
jgi:GNAT superfamily N-acetyltransferase